MFIGDRGMSNHLTQTNNYSRPKIRIRWRLQITYECGETGDVHLEAPTERVSVCSDRCTVRVMRDSLGRKSPLHRVVVSGR